MSKVYFILTNEHLKLMKKLWFTSYDNKLIIEPKTPYGNSDIMNDICKILDIEGFEDDWGEIHYPKGTEDRCFKIHEEMATALQVVTRTFSFKTGLYASDEYINNWELVEWEL